MGWFRRKLSGVDSVIRDLMEEVDELSAQLDREREWVRGFRGELHEVRTEVGAAFEESTLDAVKRMKIERDRHGEEKPFRSRLIELTPDAASEYMPGQSLVEWAGMEIAEVRSRLDAMQAENKCLREGINSARVALGVDIKTEPPESEPVPIVYGDTRGIYTEGVDTGPTYAGGEMIDDGETGDLLDDCKVNVGKFDGVDSVSLDIEMPFGYHSRDCKGAVTHHCFISEVDEIVNTCGASWDGCHGTNMWDDVDCPACLKRREADDDEDPPATAVGKVREVERIADSRPSTSDYPWAMLFTCAGCLDDKDRGDREPSVDEWLCTDCHASGVVVVDPKPEGLTEESTHD